MFLKESLRLDSFYCTSPENQIGYYLYSPLHGHEIAEKIKAEFVYEEDSFSYNGWLVNRI